MLYIYRKSGTAVHETARHKYATTNSLQGAVSNRLKETVRHCVFIMCIVMHGLFARTVQRKMVHKQKGYAEPAYSIPVVGHVA